MDNTKSKHSLFIKLIFVILCTCCFLCRSNPGASDSWRERTFKRMNEDISGQTSSDRYLPALPVSLDKGKKYYIFSDFHRGNGGKVDYFNHNRKMLTTIFSDIFYEIQDIDWIDWLRNVFFDLFRSSIDAQKRIENLKSIKIK